jgi:hypothetical protein
VSGTCQVTAGKGPLDHAPPDPGPEPEQPPPISRGGDNAPDISGDALYVTDLTDMTVPPLGPNPEDPEDQHRALITALVKIFTAGYDDEHR